MKKQLFSFVPVLGMILAGAQFVTFSLNGNSSSSAWAAEDSSIPIAPLSIKTAQGSNGDFLTDSKGKTLYAFDLDPSGQSSCRGQCLQIWPPVIIPNGQNAMATGSADSAMLGTIQRSDGSKQVTYNGLPLYYFKDDQKTGDTKGEGITSFGANWYLVKPDGTKVMPAITPETRPSRTPQTTPPGTPETSPPSTPETGSGGGYLFPGEAGADAGSNMKCDSHGKCSHPGGGGGHRCGYYQCDWQGLCCDQCNHCYNTGHHTGH